MKTLQTLFAFMLSFAVCAEEHPLYCRPTGTLVTKTYFVNGVWNTKPTARFSLTRIKQAYGQQLKEQYPDQSFEFTLAYNYSFGKVQDLVEVIAQKERELGLESNDLTPRQYLALYMTAQALNNNESDNDLPPALRSRLLSVTVEDYFAAQFTEAVNADEIVQKLRNDLLEGSRAIMIAHSQGNLYAGEAMRSLMNEYTANINMVGVASSSRELYNENLYYTAYDDRVINKLRDYYEVLPANVDNDPGVFDDKRDISNHQFIPSYFAEGLVSRTLIDDAFFNYIANLQFPVAVVNTGIITATLRWGEQPDVDLHALEPNGFHVFYSYPQGMSGYLDLDDVDAFGPEHYYVSCETLEAGTYHFGVNYFYGTAPETAYVQIVAGTSVRSFTVPLVSAVGSFGNETPVPIADVTVTGNATEGFGFIVEAM